MTEQENSLVHQEKAIYKAFLCAEQKDSATLEDFFSKLLKREVRIKACLGSVMDSIGALETAGTVDLLVRTSDDQYIMLQLLTQEDKKIYHKDSITP